MHIRTFVRAMSGGTAVVLALGSSHSSAQLAPVSSKDDTPSAVSGAVLEDIVVTAQKREQRLQDVGIAITALRGDALQEMGVANATDLVQFIPTLKMNAYSSAQAVFNIRGVSQNDYGDQQEPPVAVYQDWSALEKLVQF